MRSGPSPSATTRAALCAAAAVLVASSGLAACGRTSAPADALPPPAASDQPLAGAPEGAPPEAVAPPPAPYGPPPSYAPPGAQANADMGEPPPLEAPSAAPGIVAMAPIPNPPEREAGAPPQRYGRAYSPQRSPQSRRRTVLAGERAHARAPRSHARRVVVRHPVHAQAEAPRPAAARASLAAPHLRTVPVRPAPAAQSPTTAHRQHLAATHHASHSRTTTTTSSHGADGSSRADRVSALQTALGGEVARNAKLDTPHLAPGTAADVTLTAPASFADALRTEAGRQGLADDAASAALVARLSGDGYTVLPEGEQRQTVVAGKPTVIHWTVTAQPNARGPLQAQVGAQLLGGGQDRLDLGVVKAATAGGDLGWKVVGGVLLALVVGLLIALFARAGRPARARRRVPDGEVRRHQPFTMEDPRT